MTGSFPDGCLVPCGFADGSREEGGQMRTPALAVLSYCVVVALAAIASLAQTPSDFPMWCRGTAGMASSSGKNLIIDFTPAPKRAPDGLEPGQCSWLDRTLRPNEPTRIVSEQFSVSTAQQVAGEINGGADWTFWVFNVGRFFKGTTSSRGTQRRKPANL